MTLSGYFMYVKIHFRLALPDSATDFQKQLR